jgi:hypothetical protein
MQQDSFEKHLSIACNNIYSNKETKIANYAENTHTLGR